jgi:hypothetical protein
MSKPETKDDLDWARFTTAYYPGRRRHDMKVLTAYGAYRRSQMSFERPAGDVHQTAALTVWEDEGGPVL